MKIFYGQLCNCQKLPQQTHQNAEATVRPTVSGPSGSRPPPLHSALGCISIRASAGGAPGSVSREPGQAINVISVLES